MAVRFGARGVLVPGFDPPLNRTLADSPASESASSFNKYFKMFFERRGIVIYKKLFLGLMRSNGVGLSALILIRFLSVILGGNQA